MIDFHRRHRVGGVAKGAVGPPIVVEAEKDGEVGLCLDLRAIALQVAPSPGTGGSIEIEAPKLVKMSRQIASPSPKPLDLVVWNG